MSQALQKENVMATETNSPAIKIAIGKISIEYCGDQNFIENGLLEFIESMIETSGKIPPALSVENERSASKQGGLQPSNVQHMSTNTIASQLGASTGPELAMAAIAHIQLVRKNDKATRSEIFSEMKSATTYYKSTFGGNLSASLNGLVKAKRLNLIADNTYALSASERSKMESALATA
jgi:hypothetical protein